MIRKLSLELSYLELQFMGPCQDLRGAHRAFHWTAVDGTNVGCLQALRQCFCLFLSIGAKIVVG